MEKIDISDVITRLLAPRNAPPGTVRVELKLNEVKYLIEKSREIFLLPNLSYWTSRHHSK